MSYELTELMAIIGAIMLFYFGRLLIEMEVYSIATKYISRIIGANMMLLGGHYWLTPTPETTMTSLILAVIVVVVGVGFLFIKFKDFGEKLGIFTMGIVMLGVLFCFNVVYLSILVNVIVVVATTYEIIKK